MNKQVGSLPAGVDLLLYAGDDFWMRLYVTDDDEQPVDFTGVTVNAEIRDAVGPAGQLLAEFITEVAADGTHILLQLLSVDTAALPAVAFWDVETVDTDGTVTTLAFGRVKTTAQVTQP